MKFNDRDHKLGLIQDCEDLLGMEDTAISADNNLLRRFTKNLNAWYRKVNTLIWQATGTWEYDDSSYTDLPIATTTMVDAQQDYELPSAAQRIDRIEVKDSGGIWHKLNPIDKAMIGGALDEHRKTDGLPVEYDLLGRTIMLYPAPATASITAANGLKVYFSREIEEFGAIKTGTADGTIAYHLQDDTSAQFAETDEDRTVWNVTDSVSAVISAYNDAGDVTVGTSDTVDSDVFATSDVYVIYDTKEPGFADNFHRILSLGAALDYTIGFNPDDTGRINNLRGEISSLKEDIQEFYAHRHRDFKTRIRPKQENYI